MTQQEELENTIYMKKYCLLVDVRCRWTGESLFYKKCNKVFDAYQALDQRENDPRNESVAISLITQRLGQWPPYVNQDVPWSLLEGLADFELRAEQWG